MAPRACGESCVTCVFPSERTVLRSPGRVSPWALPGDPESDARASSLLHLPEAEKFSPEKEEQSPVRRGPGCLGFDDSAQFCGFPKMLSETLLEISV